MKKLLSIIIFINIFTLSFVQTAEKNSNQLSASFFAVHQKEISAIDPSIIQSMEAYPMIRGFLEKNSSPADLMIIYDSIFNDQEKKDLKTWFFAQSENIKKKFLTFIFHKNINNVIKQYKTNSNTFNAIFRAYPKIKR